MLCFRTFDFPVPVFPAVMRRFLLHIKQLPRMMDQVIRLHVHIHAANDKHLCFIEFLS